MSKIVGARGEGNTHSVCKTQLEVIPYILRHLIPLQGNDPVSDRAT